MKKWTVTKTTSYLLAAMLGTTTAAISWADQLITGIRVAPAPGSTRVVFDLSGPAPYKLFMLENPSRVVVDFSDTNSIAPNVGIPSEAAVTNVRSAVQANNALRMVLDLKQSASVKGFMLPPDGQSGHRLVVDIAQTGVAGANAATVAQGGSIGAAHIYGGNPFGGAANPQKNRPPVVDRPAMPASAPSEVDVMAIRAMLEQPSRPAPAKPVVAKPQPMQVKPQAPQVSGLLEAHDSRPVAPVNVTPPPVAAVSTVKDLPAVAAVAEKAPVAPVVSRPAVTAKPVPVVSEPVKPVSAPVAASAVAVKAPIIPAKAIPAPVKAPTLAQPGNLRDVIVAIDAGHGGQDPGAIGPSGIREKYITLAIARALRDELSRQQGVKAELVRTGDYFIPLASRRDIARTKLKADLFVSIHADAALARKARGASVFALSRNGATSSLAQMLADRENQSDLVGGALEDKDKMVASVIADLALEGAMEHSMKVGGTVLRELGSTTLLHKRYIEKAGFAVLKSADFPSILVETGFISNPQEESNLRSGAHQQKLARAITRGVMSYFSGNPPPGTYLAWKRDKGATTLAYADFSSFGGDTRHTISRGDTLEKIATRYQVGVSDLRRANALSGKDNIRVGQVLQIPDT